MAWAELILAFIGGGALTTLISMFLFYRQNRRIKNSEATEYEVKILHTLIATLKSEINRNEQRIISLEERLSDKDELIVRLDAKVYKMEQENYNHKSAVNCAISCPYPVPNKGCPVLLKITELNV